MIIAIGLDDFEKFFSKKFILQTVSDFSDFALNPQPSVELMQKSGLCFNNHITVLLKKYYIADSLKSLFVEISQ